MPDLTDDVGTTVWVRTLAGMSLLVAMVAGLALLYSTLAFMLAHETSKDVSALRLAVEQYHAEGK